MPLVQWTCDTVPQAKQQSDRARKPRPARQKDEFPPGDTSGSTVMFQPSCADALDTSHASLLDLSQEPEGEQAGEGDVMKELDDFIDGE